MVTTSGRRRWWVLAGIAILAAAALALAALASNQPVPPATVEANTCLTLKVLQDEKGAGETVDLDFNFAGDGNCQTPVATVDVLTIVVPQEMGVSGLGREDVTIYVGGAYQPRWMDIGSGDDNAHEIRIGGCTSWQDYGGEPPDDCDTRLTDVRIVLRNLRLPARPLAYDGYEVWVKWSGVALKRHALDVYPTLQVSDDDKNVRYGETVTITGVGFEAGATVDLYAQKSTDNGKNACNFVIGPTWRKIATASVGSGGRFMIKATVGEDRFHTAGRYLICPRDDTGNQLDDPIAIQVAGASVRLLSDITEVAPGREIDLLVTGHFGEVESVTAGGMDAPIKSRLGDVLTVIMPPGLSGVVTIRVHFLEADSTSVKVTVAESALTVTGIRGDGIALGGVALVSTSRLSGRQVCSVTLGGVPIALLDDRREFPAGGCIAIRQGGRFNATVLVADRHGNLGAPLIARFAALKPGGTLQMEVTDDVGNRASAPVPVAVPEVTIDAPGGIVKRSQPIIIRGRNFPPNHSDYFQVPPVVIKVGDRLTRSIYPSAVGDWEFEYHYTSRHRPGEYISVEVSMGRHRPRLVIDSFHVRITPLAITVMPERVRIGTPIVITVTGLEPSTAGYGVRIRSGPHLTIDGSPSFFTTDRHGEFTGTARFPEYEPHSFNLNGEATIYLEVVQSNRALPGAHATLTQQRGHHPTPTLAVQLATATPEPTATLVPTHTPMVTHTPAPTLTSPPLAWAPVTRAPTPTPAATETPLPSPTIDRHNIEATVVARVVAPTIEALKNNASAGLERDEAHSGIVLYLLIVPITVSLLLIVVATVVKKVRFG